MANPKSKGNMGTATPGSDFGDQKTDNDKQNAPNMTINTTSKSPSTGQAARFRPDDATSDNNWYKDVPGRTFNPVRRDS